QRDVAHVRESRDLARAVPETSQPAHMDDPVHIPVPEGQSGRRQPDTRLRTEMGDRAEPACGLQGYLVREVVSLIRSFCQQRGRRGASSAVSAFAGRNTVSCCPVSNASSYVAGHVIRVDGGTW